jgi:hypothetical protein
LTRLLFEKFAFEFFLVDNAIQHDEAIPKVDACKSHFRITVFNSIYKDLKIKSGIIGLNDKVWLFLEDDP